MTRVDLSEHALDDLSAIFAHIARDSTQAARRLVTDILAQVEALSAYPQMGNTRGDLPEGLFRLVVRGYVVVYGREEDVLTILRVLHGARDIGALFD